MCLAKRSSFIHGERSSSAARRGRVISLFAAGESQHRQAALQPQMETHEHEMNEAATVFIRLCTLPSTIFSGRKLDQIVLPHGNITQVEFLYITKLQRDVKPSVLSNLLGREGRSATI